MCRVIDMIIYNRRAVRVILYLWMLIWVSLYCRQAIQLRHYLPKVVSPLPHSWVEVSSDSGVPTAPCSFTFNPDRRTLWRPATCQVAYEGVPCLCGIFGTCEYSAGTCGNWPLPLCPISKEPWGIPWGPTSPYGISSYWGTSPFLAFLGSQVEYPFPFCCFLLPT